MFRKILQNNFDLPINMTFCRQLHQLSSDCVSQSPSPIWLVTYVSHSEHFNSIVKYFHKLLIQTRHYEILLQRRSVPAFTAHPGLICSSKDSGPSFWPLNLPKAVLKVILHFVITNWPQKHEMQDRNSSRNEQGGTVICSASSLYIFGSFLKNTSMDK